MTIERYAAIIREIGLPERAIACMTGDLKLPSEMGDVPFRAYGFPPALLPLWSSQAGPDYYGFWWHWGGRRKTTIVRLMVEGGYRAFEYARTLDQLMTIVALDKLVADEGISSELESFAAAADVKELEDLERIALESGDQFFGLLQRPEFQRDAPVECFDDLAAYTGDFPTELSGVRSSDLRWFAGLEGPKSVAERIAARPDAPPWFKSRQQAGVFESCMRADDCAGAWMSLNSPGWSFSDAEVALSELARRSGDRILRLVADAWRSQPHVGFGGY